MLIDPKLIRTPDRLVRAAEPRSELTVRAVRAVDPDEPRARPQPFRGRPDQRDNREVQTAPVTAAVAMPGPRGRSPAWIKNAAAMMRPGTDPHVLLSQLESERVSDERGFAHPHRSVDCGFCRQAASKYDRPGNA